MNAISTPQIVEFDRVSKRFDRTPVLNECSAGIAAGEVVVVCGPSGSGKSTLIKCVNGLVKPDSGEVRLHGQSIHASRKTLDQARASTGMVFQHFELFPHLSVLQNVNLAQIKVLRRSRAEAEEKSRELLRRMGIAEHAGKYPAEISGGQQQRAAIARSLAMDPSIMLFDEPTSALDPEMIGEVLDVMGELARAGMTMMVVTHEMGFASKVADRVIFMSEGRIEEDLPVQAFFGDSIGSRARTFLSRIIRH